MPEPTTAATVPPADSSHLAPRTRLRPRVAVPALILAAVIWLPLVHLFFTPAQADLESGAALSPTARAMAAYQMRLWTEPALRKHEIERMRASNAEWDFMGRTFFVLALANITLREPARQSETLAVIDVILAETRRLELEHGHLYFLMDYARANPFIDSSGRSIFVDGEIAMMLAARQLVAPNPTDAPLLQDRVQKILAQMQRGPLLCGESYPNECWLFCNAVALAAVRMSDRLTGEDHSAFFKSWLATARPRLTDARTGLLASSFTLEGDTLDGPEGSSIFWASHCLELIDPALARDQFQRARDSMRCAMLGFGYAREWPRGFVGAQPDIDSGPVIPILQASAGSSGFAIVGAAAFGDRAWLRELLTSLNFAGFPARHAGTLRYQASNEVGDAVLLYALTQGPLWQRVQQGAKP
jgi:hypothetical protein